MLNLIHSALYLYSIVIIVSVIFSWVGASELNPLVRVVRDLTEPLLRRIRTVAPLVVFGGMDFSPLLAILLVQVVGRLVDLVLG